MSKRYSERENRLLVSGWAGSGESRAAYAARHGIPAGSLARWEAELGPAVGTAGQVKCGPLRASASFWDRYAVCPRLEPYGQVPCLPPRHRWTGKVWPPPCQCLILEQVRCLHFAVCPRLDRYFVGGIARGHFFRTGLVKLLAIGFVRV